MSRIFRVSIEGDTYEVIVDELTPGTNKKPLPPIYSRATEKHSSPIARPRRPEKEDPSVLSGDVRAMMTGGIVEILVEEGQTVANGQPLMILEAMKMENQVLAPKAGTVKQINVKKGEKVNDGDLLCTFE